MYTHRWANQPSHPTYARILAGATLGVLFAPAATILAIVTGHTVWAQVGVFATTAAYPVGFCAAVWRYGQRIRAAIAEAHHEAHRDALTGLPTRAVADRLLEAATRDGTPMTVALADIDGLNAINSFGHAAGDQYLTAVAQRLARAVPPGGCLVRQGGDEFTILAPDTSPDELATSIGVAMAGPAIIAGHRIQPRASVGIAQSGGGDATYARACADAAMYTAKAAGGNHTMIYQPARDGYPLADGTRPWIRRRDLNPLAQEGIAWRPAPGDELLPLLVSAAEARTISDALAAARDRWARAAIEARAGFGRPESPPSTEPGWMTIEPTPGGYRGIAQLAELHRARYAQLVDRLAPIVDMVQTVGDATNAPG
jgi:diguanylate cyclase (GGDEF)-like protein